MEVLHFSKFYPPEHGGIELFVSDLVEQLAPNVACDVLCANTNNKTIVEKRKTYTIFRAASFGKMFATSVSPATIALFNKLKEDYDLVHLHLPNPMANLAYFLVRPDAKLVLHWHSDILRQKNLMLLYRPLQDWLLKRADLIVTTSKNYLEHSEYLRKYKEKCTVIPLGLNPDRLLVNEDKIREIKKQFNDKPIVFSIGRLTYYKGLEYLVDAVKDIDAYLLIGGSGPVKTALLHQIQRLRLSEKVFLLGQIADKELGAYYEACDIFCLPSIYKTEAFGLVQVEAMCFGKPLVSTDIAGSGVSWVNQNNITGLVVPPKNSAALANALTKIISNPELKAKLGNNGGKRVEKEFHIKVIADRILRAYEHLL